MEGKGRGEGGRKGREKERGGRRKGKGGMGILFRGIGAPELHCRLIVKKLSTSYLVII